MPKTAKPMWLYTWILVFAQPLVVCIHFLNLGSSGRLPLEGDSIGIPIFGNIIAWISVTPFLLLLTWLMLRRYNPKSHLFAWDLDRPVRSIIASATLGGCGIALMLLSAFDFRAAYAWYDHMLTVYTLCWAAWFLAMRAAVVRQLPRSI